MLLQYSRPLVNLSRLKGARLQFEKPGTKKNNQVYGTAT